MAKSDRAFRALARSNPEIVAEFLRVTAPHALPPGVDFTIDDLAPTQVDALPHALDADCVARVGDDEIQHIEFQGYRDSSFGDRCVWYHVGIALPYRGRRRVRTTAIWLTPLPKNQPRNVMRHADISVRVKTIVLPKVPATKLLARPKTACFAAGANAQGWSAEDLCFRVATAFRERNATWPERHIAVVAAAMQGRYDAMVTAMEQLHMEPIIIEDLVKFGEDRGFDRGLARGIAKERARMIEMRLGCEFPQAVQEQLIPRVGAMSPLQFSEVLFKLSHADLEAWVTDPNAK